MDTLENRLQRRIHVSLYALVFLTVLLGLSVLLESCTDSCEVKNVYTYYEPVYTSLEELRGGVKVTPPQTLKAVGKIYLKDNFVFINEPGEGIHIIDNQNPSAPVVKSFIKIPGNYDLAIKGKTLYADSFIDLVSIDISDIENIKEVHRVENAFSNYSTLGFSIDPNRGLITDWVAKEQVEMSESDCDIKLQTWGDFCGTHYQDGVALANTSEAFSKSAAIAPGNGSGPGVGGSMARFTISKDHLYILDAGSIQPLDVSSESNPVAKEKVYLNWDIETIFPYQDHLFVGSSSGMHILNVSNPSAPEKVSTYAHVTSCDPVVVQGDFAYVTLRSGTQCQGFSNQLEVIDIKNLETPQLLKTYQMHNPHGLGIDNNTLFICDGNDGLKVYDATDINSIDQNQVAHYKDIHAFDVIPFNNTLIMIGNDGLFQYDYSNPKDIKLLSTIQIADAN